MDWPQILAGLLVAAIVLTPFIIFFIAGAREVNYVKKHGPRPKPKREPSKDNWAGGGHWI